MDQACPTCSTANPEAARFCMACGARIDAAPTEQRRVVTVLFADLSGFTAISERLDPEAVKSVVAMILRRLADEVERHGGTVDKYIGDNVMALFGAPVAHDDDPERAVRAGLAMQRVMVELDPALPGGAQFALRVGINTGEVIAGGMGGSYTVIGDTVNVAARLQSAAQRGEVVVGERTQAEAGDAIVWEPLEPLTLKGKREPVAAWRALDAAVAHGRSPATRGQDVPFVGRAADLRKVHEVLARTTAERSPALVSIIGQPGVGKSRLMREVGRGAAGAGAGVRVLTGRTPAYGSAAAAPELREALGPSLGLPAGGAGDWESLHGAVVQLLSPQGRESDAAADRHAGALARAFAVEMPDQVRNLLEDEPERARRQLGSAVTAALTALAERGPVVVVLDDVHWSDASVLAAVAHAATFAQGPVMLVCLAREELLDRRPDWDRGVPDAIRLDLQPLSPEDTRELAEAVLGTGHDPTLTFSVVDRSGGNPLFAEELARSMAESGGAAPANLPGSIHGVLAARLDRLAPSERTVVEDAAILGRSFRASWLAQMTPRDPAVLERSLKWLHERGLLREDGDGALSFTHVLLRDTAYSTIPLRLRVDRHLRAADVVSLEADDDEWTVRAAEHLEGAVRSAAEVGRDDAPVQQARSRAASALEDAGRLAMRAHAYEAAADRFARSLAVEAGDDADRVRRGGHLGEALLRLGHVDRAITAWREALATTATPRRAAYLTGRIAAALAHRGDMADARQELAAALAMLADDRTAPELIDLLQGAAELDLQAGQTISAIASAEKAVRLAGQLGRDHAAASAQGILGHAFGRLGDRDAGRRHLEQSVALYRDAASGPSVDALVSLARHLEAAGDVPSATATYTEAAQLAAARGDVPRLVEVRGAMSALAYLAGDEERAAREAEQAILAGENENLLGALARPQAVRAALARRHDPGPRAEELSRHAEDLAERSGARASLAEMLLWRGQDTAATDAGRATSIFDRAIDVCERAGLLDLGLEALAAKALTLHRAGLVDEARTTAASASGRSGRGSRPAEAAAAQLRAIASDTPKDTAALLRDAAQAWSAAGRAREASLCTTTADAARLL